MRPTAVPALAWLLLLLAPSAAGAEVAAAWQRHEIEFTYMGFTTRYSCEGLRDKLGALLKASGARPGFIVSRSACSTTGPGQVTDFPRMRLTFESAAIPASGSRGTGQPTLARWKPVSLSRRQPRQLEAGDCELVEQFVDRVLPAFTTRALQADIHCIPHQLSGSSFLLGFEVLEGLPAADDAVPPR